MRILIVLPEHFSVRNTLIEHAVTHIISKSWSLGKNLFRKEKRIFFRWIKTFVGAEISGVCHDALSTLFCHDCDGDIVKFY